MLGGSCSPCCGQLCCDVPPDQLTFRITSRFTSYWTNPISGALSPFDYIVRNCDTTFSEVVTLTRSDLIYGTGSYSGQPTGNALSFVFSSQSTVDTEFCDVPQLWDHDSTAQTSPIDFSYVANFGGRVTTEYDSVRLRFVTQYQYPLRLVRRHYVVNYETTSDPLVCYNVSAYVERFWRPAYESLPQIDMTLRTPATVEESQGVMSGSNPPATVLRASVRRSPATCLPPPSDLSQLIYRNPAGEPLLVATGL
jgi:hypothetical protein